MQKDSNLMLALMKGLLSTVFIILVAMGFNCTIINKNKNFWIGIQLTVYGNKSEHLVFHNWKRIAKKKESY